MLMTSSREPHTLAKNFESTPEGTADRLGKKVSVRGLESIETIKLILAVKCFRNEDISL